MAKIYKLFKTAFFVPISINISFQSTRKILKLLKLSVFIWTLSVITSLTLHLVSGESCGDSIPGKEGYFTHPEYPANYSSDMKCRWSTSARDEDKVKFWLEELDIEEDRDGKCNYDYLSIKFPNEERPVRFCGQKTKYADEGRTPYYNGTGIPKIEFVSDDSVEMAGFKIRFKIERYDYCQSSPCENDGSCILDDSILINGFYCKCEEGFGGQLCESDTNECASNPCLNEGTCSTPDFGMYECSCLDGTSGTNCEIDEDECISDPCYNGGTCSDLLNSFSCVCSEGFTGSSCQTEIDECESSPCMNEGRCIDKISEYLCDCVAGYEGKQCEFEIDECNSDPCHNGGICKDKVNGFECECKSGYNGETCEKDTNECLSFPCMNNGRCVDKLNRFECNCADGYSGKSCEYEIDECDSSPCKNDAYCVDYPASFFCDCRKGYDGVLCEIDMCERNPCKNNGVCIRSSSRKIECKCSPGYYGTYCDQDVCLSMPCQNGGKCFHGAESYLCECRNDFSGDNCEYRNREKPEKSQGKPNKDNLDEKFNDNPLYNTPMQLPEGFENDGDDNKGDKSDHAIALAFSIVSLFMMLAIVCMLAYWLLLRKKKFDDKKDTSKKKNVRDYTKQKTERKSLYSARKRRQIRKVVTSSSMNSSEELYKNNISLEDIDNYQNKSTIDRPSMFMNTNTKEPMAFVGTLSETEPIVIPSSFNAGPNLIASSQKPSRISYIHLPETENQASINNFKRSSMFDKPYASPQNYIPNTNYRASLYKNTEGDVYDDDLSLKSYISSRISGEDSYASQSPTSSDEDTKKETFWAFDKQENSSDSPQISSEDVKKPLKKENSLIPYKQPDLSNKSHNPIKEKQLLHWNARDDNRLNNFPVEHHLIPEVNSEIDTGVAKATENIKDQLNWKHKNRVSINRINPTSNLKNNIPQTEIYLADEKKQPQKKVQFKGVGNFKSSKGKFDTSRRTISKFVPSRNRRSSTSSGVYTSESTSEGNKSSNKNAVSQLPVKPFSTEKVSVVEKQSTNNRRLIKKAYQNLNNGQHLGLNRENAFVKKQ